MLTLSTVKMQDRTKRTIILGPIETMLRFRSVLTLGNIAMKDMQKKQYPKNMLTRDVPSRVRVLGRVLRHFHYSESA